MRKIPSNKLVWHPNCYLVVIFAVMLPGLAIADEALTYKANYRGVLSMGSDLPIADATLVVSGPAESEGLVEIRLEASSEHYPAVETLYPFRYRFRSWSAPAGQSGVVAFEAYEKTRREKHTMYLAGNSASKPVERVSPTEFSDVSRLAARRSSEDAIADPSPTLWDRLGLLHHIRQLRLSEGGHYTFDVTSGSKHFHYAVHVEAQQELVLGNVTAPAWKVRFDGQRRRDDGSLKSAHRPLYIWFSHDARQVPLRIEARHPIGLFRLELVDSGELPRFARADH